MACDVATSRYVTRSDAKKNGTPCGAGKTCQNGSCVAGATCSGDIKNGDETGVDWGTSYPPCAAE